MSPQTKYLHHLHQSVTNPLPKSPNTPPPDPFPFPLSTTLAHSTRVPLFKCLFSASNLANCFLHPSHSNGQKLLFNCSCHLQSCSFANPFPHPGQCHLYSFSSKWDRKCPLRLKKPRVNVDPAWYCACEISNLVFVVDLDALACTSSRHVRFGYLCR